MLFPIGDTPNPPRGSAPVNLILIALNVLMFVLVSLPLSSRGVDPYDPAVQDYVLQVARLSGQHPVTVFRNTSAYDLFVWQFGFRATEGSWQSLVLSMFLHAGWMHLLGNMLFLWIFGDNVEHRMGSLKYLASYLVTGAAATILHTMFVEEQGLPLIGASGAISGVLGFYYVWFPTNQVKLFFWLWFFVSTFLVPARIVLSFYLIVENLLPFLLTPSAGSGVAYGAHIGGFLAGFLLARWEADDPDHLRMSSVSSTSRSDSEFWR